jgi:hypothetical protein
VGEAASIKKLPRDYSCVVTATAHDNPFPLLSNRIKETGVICNASPGSSGNRLSLHPAALHCTLPAPAVLLYDRRLGC